MNQLYGNLEELLGAIQRLDPINDSELIEYLTGEVQHLINRTQCRNASALTTEEAEELRFRREMIEIFKMFYAFLLITAPSDPSYFDEA